MMIALQIFLGVVLYFMIKYLAYYVIEKKQMIPKFLNYKPFNCVKCCTFWTSIFVFSTIFFLNLNATAIIGILLTTLDAIAQTINEKEKTISLKDYDKYDLN